MKSYEIDGYICSVGSNASDNWKILKTAKQNDIFFHLSSYSSCYVILHCNGENVNEEIIKKCALICKQNSKYRNIYLYVDYTTCKNVIFGKELGECYYKSNKKVFRIFV